MTSNADVLAMLGDLISLTALDEESNQSFKVRAYEGAKLALESLGRDFASMSTKELLAIDGVGKATATKIVEFVETGQVEKLEALRATYPPAFAELVRIPGVGPKTAKLMRAELGVENVDDLRAAVEAEQIRSLPRMGAKSEAKIGKAIDRLGLTGKDRRTPVADAMPIAERLVEALAGIESVVEVAYCGSLRRMAETIGDIDITVAAHDPAAVMAAVRNRPEVAELVVGGDTKTSFLTPTGLQVDVRAVEPEHFGAATLYFTGSKQHNILLRQRAIDRGLLLNEYGLFPAPDPDGSHEGDSDQGQRGEAVAARTEADIYAALDLAFIPAPMREGTGEIARADTGDTGDTDDTDEGAADPMADLIRLQDIIGDLHYHTDRSGDGRSTVAEMVEVGAQAGYRYLAITDHGEDLPINGSNAAEMLEHREVIAELDEAYPDLALLWGCELNIGAGGGLDYDADFRAEFDYTVASVHSHFDQPVARQTERLVAAIADPTVDSIGHLTGRYIGRRPGIEIDVDIVLEALLHFDVALEINGSLNRLDAAADVVRRAVDRGVKLVINTDSHHTSELGRMAYGVATAQRGWAPRDQVINTWEPDRFLEWVRTHREGVPFA